jgi:carboxypeptidase PM20D1
MSDKETFINHFKEAIQLRTDWPGESKKAAGEAQLTAFQDFLVRTYPAFHAAAERQVYSPYAVAYKVPGTENKEKPALILSHYDVVPAEMEKWTVPAFDAVEKDGFIYGRGTEDMKNILIAEMEALETLIQGGWKPKNDIWLAFGGDEERSGILGAMNTVKTFAEKGLKFSWLLDEGTPIAVDQIKGVGEPLALLGVEEKGFLSLELSVKQKPGHASQPPKEQAAAIMGAALVKLAEIPFPFRLVDTVEGFFTALAPHAASKGLAWAMKHARSLGGIFFKAVSGTPSIAAMLHTTVAETMLQGSGAENVLPSEVKAVINLRLLAPWTVKSATEKVKEIIADDRISIRDYGVGTDPVPANKEHTQRRGPGWDIVQNAVDTAFPGVPCLPFLMLATTDSRHFKDLADGIIRFNPYKMTPKDLAGIHGHDERVSIEALLQSEVFYRKVFEQL